MSVTGVESDDLLPNEPRGELSSMKPNPNVEAKLPVREIFDFPLMVYCVDLNGKYFKCPSLPINDTLGRPQH